MAQVQFPQSNQVSGITTLFLPTLGNFPLQGALTTPAAVATPAYTWLPLADGTYVLITSAAAKRASNGNSASFLTQALVKVIAGVVTIVAQAAILASQADGGFAPSIAFAVVGATLQLQVTGVADPVSWTVNTAVTSV